MKITNIEWCDFSSNPLCYRDTRTNKVVWACVKKSSGCANCYAEQIAERFDRGAAFTRANMEHLTPFLDEKELRAILTQKTISHLKVPGRRCFLGDMTDVFGEWVSDELLDRLFAVLALRGDVTFQILTKRPDRMADYFTAGPGLSRFAAVRGEMFKTGRPMPDCWQYPADANRPWPLPNMWLGTSVENQAAADERIPHLLRVPAAVRFLSCEPLLGETILHKHLAQCECGHGHGFTACPNTGGVAQTCHLCDCWKLRPKLHWVICGGESGPGARPFDLDWARSIQNQCDAAGVPWFMKQAGSAPRDWDRGDAANFEPPELVQLRLKDKKGGDLHELPPALRVREFPETGA